MRVVVQRVSRASVKVDGTIVGEIEAGLLVLVGIRGDETADTLRWVSDKVLNLRIFPDAENKMNRSLLDIGGELLTVSQFTLYGDCRKGRRPSFIEAAQPDVAVRLFDQFVETLKKSNVKVETGTFGAMMDVELVNDGPVTLILER